MTTKAVDGIAISIYLLGVARAVTDLLNDMKANPKGVRFADAMRVGEHFFGAARKAGSHRVFKMPWPGDPRVNLQEGKNGEAKSYQVKQLLQAVDKVEGLSKEKE